MIPYLATLGGCAMLTLFIVYLARARFSERSNEVELRIEQLLPQTQCAQCGYPGCKPYAQAIAKGEAINRCPPGGEAVIEALATLLNRPAPPSPMTSNRCRFHWLRELLRKTVLAVLCASRPAPLMPLSAVKIRCTPSSRRFAPVANSVCPRAQSIASSFLRSPRLRFALCLSRRVTNLASCAALACRPAPNILTPNDCF